MAITAFIIPACQMVTTCAVTQYWLKSFKCIPHIRQYTHTNNIRHNNDVVEARTTNARVLYLYQLYPQIAYTQRGTTRVTCVFNDARWIVRLFRALRNVHPFRMAGVRRTRNWQLLWPRPTSHMCLLIYHIWMIRFECRETILMSALSHSSIVFVLV